MISIFYQILYCLSRAYENLGSVYHAMGLFIPPQKQLLQLPSVVSYLQFKNIGHGKDYCSKLKCQVSFGLFSFITRSVSVFHHVVPQLLSCRKSALVLKEHNTCESIQNLTILQCYHYEFSSSKLTVVHLPLAVGLELVCVIFSQVYFKPY